MKIHEVDAQSLPQAAEIHAISWRESHKGFCYAALLQSIPYSGRRNFSGGSGRQGSGCIC